MATKRKTTGIQKRKGPTKRGAASASKSRAPATQRAKRASPAPAKRASTPARPAVATTPVATQLPRDPKGKRAQFYQDPAIDQLWAVVAAITGEVSVAFDRLDTLERLLERDGGVTRDSIEAYRPDESAAAERARRREELIQRVFQVLSQYGR